MRLYRIVRRPYADLSGSGGVYGPGRWHEQGVHLIYTATSISLAALEFALHSAVRPPDTMLLEIEIGDAAWPPLLVSDFIGGPLPWKLVCGSWTFASNRNELARQQAIRGIGSTFSCNSPGTQCPAEPQSSRIQDSREPGQDRTVFLRPTAFQKMRKRSAFGTSA